MDADSSSSSPEAPASPPQTDTGDTGAPTAAGTSFPFPPGHPALSGRSVHAVDTAEAATGTPLRFRYPMAAKLRGQAGSEVLDIFFERQASVFKHDLCTCNAAEAACNLLNDAFPHPGAIARPKQLLLALRAMTAKHDAECVHCVAGADRVPCRLAQLLTMTSMA